MKKASRLNSLCRAFDLLTHILLIYLTMWYVQVSLTLGQGTSFTLFINQGIALIQTITGLSWWDIHSPNFMPQLYISDFLTIWRVVISKLRTGWFLASSPEGFQRQLDALALFCDFQQLTVNLGKTKVMILNWLKKTSNLHFFLRE
jgi:hypothetical protein